MRNSPRPSLVDEIGVSCLPPLLPELGVLADRHSLLVVSEFGDLVKAMGLSELRFRRAANKPSQQRRLNNRGVLSIQTPNPSLGVPTSQWAEVDHATGSANCSCRLRFVHRLGCPVHKVNLRKRLLLQCFTLAIDCRLDSPL